MKENELSPAWVVKNFLPHFKEKWDMFCQREYGFYRDADICGIDGEFLDDYFPEALSELLKDYANTCACVAYDFANHHGFERIEELHDIVSDAPIPDPRNDK